MALINIQQVIGEVSQVIRQAEISTGVELLSYKRNRSIALIRVSETSVLVREVGYIEQEFIVELDKIVKTLKPLLKREFPRSRKVRLCKIDDIADLEREKQKI